MTKEIESLTEYLCQTGFTPDEADHGGDTWADYNHTRVVITREGEVFIYQFARAGVLAWSASFRSGVPAAVIATTIAAILKISY